MRTLLATVALVLFSSNLFAADVVCSCKGEEKCSDVKISFIPASPGMYMNIEYAYGERNLEGFASVIRDSKADEVRFYLGNFILVEKDGKYSLPGRPAVCN